MGDLRERKWILASLEFARRPQVQASSLGRSDRLVDGLAGEDVAKAVAAVVRLMEEAELERLAEPSVARSEESPAVRRRSTSGAATPATAAA